MIHKRSQIYFKKIYTQIVLQVGRDFFYTLRTFVSITLCRFLENSCKINFIAFSTFFLIEFFYHLELEYF